MKDNILTSMISEKGKISHKRAISVFITLIVSIISIYAAIKYEKYVLDIIHSMLIFISIMSGVATVAQIVSLVKGTPIVEEKQPQKEEEKKDIREPFTNA